MTDYNQLATEEQIKTATESLISHNINVQVAENGEEAKNIALKLIPEGSEVMTTSSVTLDTLSISREINESGKYNSIKAQLNNMNRETEGLQMQKLGAAPEYIIGSIHAVTEDGKVLIASNTGSQLPGYTYGSAHVIWVVSTKKIVKNLDEALERIYDFVLPQEDARMKKVYGPQVHSEVRKLLIVNSELNPGRTTLIFVKEPLGF